MDYWIQTRGKGMCLCKGKQNTPKMGFFHKMASSLVRGQKTYINNEWRSYNGDFSIKCYPRLFTDAGKAAS